MERLSADLSLALEESAGRLTRRKLGPRRRTRSAGNLPACVAAPVAEEAWSSSSPGVGGAGGPGGAGGAGGVVTQPLSDSDEALGPARAPRSRHYCHIANIESDSFNENFSPTRPANARRKRKLKKMTVEYLDDKPAPPIEIMTGLEAHIAAAGAGTGAGADRHKPLLKQERNAFCGKRKWSHIDKDGGEMRERSFSGGCTSKSAFFAKSDLKSKKHDTERRKKEVILQPGKIVLQPQNVEESRPFTGGALGALGGALGGALPGSASFNFVYKNMCRNGGGGTGYKVVTELPPAFDASSSSLSSSEGARSDSSGEGDDELTDWPGIEELKVFSRSLSFRRAPPSAAPAAPRTAPRAAAPPPLPPPKRLRRAAPEPAASTPAAPIALAAPAAAAAAASRSSKRHQAHDNDPKPSLPAGSTSSTVSDHKRRCVPAAPTLAPAPSAPAPSAPVAAAPTASAPGAVLASPPL